jgi:peptide/nickel transport system ATP-binding protein
MKRVKNAKEPNLWMPYVDQGRLQQEAALHTTPILQIRNLSVGYASRRAIAEAVTEVDLDVEPGEILGLVGESGCGKTTMAVALLGLIEPPGVIRSGSVMLRLRDGTVLDLLSIDPARQRQIRWREIAYIPQGSMSALNPVLRISRQMTDTLIEHGLSPTEALDRARWSLKLVELDPTVLDKYPHELSGGMTQRVAIAMAITLQPAVLIADKPTTALDVVTQRAILQELVKIRESFGTTILLITHDMAVIAQTVDRVAVMYAGRIVEVGPVHNIFDAPLHPYTQRLIGSIPRATGERLSGLAGESPSPWRLPPGCRFHPRCPHVMEICRSEVPPLVERRSGQRVACHLQNTWEATAHE